MIWYWWEDREQCLDHVHIENCWIETATGRSASTIPGRSDTKYTKLGVCELYSLLIQHDKLERSTMFWMFKLTIFDWPIFNSYVIHFQGLTTVYYCLPIRWSQIVKQVTLQLCLTIHSWWLSHGSGILRKKSYMESTGYFHPWLTLISSYSLCWKKHKQIMPGPDLVTTTNERTLCLHQFASQ